ncbi:hypothetical protein C5H23_02100 [Xylella fastidiosa]|uniref:hypothetical protein n=1 Tax=Xylella fastidiosa TaxID=2371 RepID=UPI0008FFED15|nr:hypothetical protein [Xylella fastidiosa]MDD0929190.1 hypothetical protein [Xylella fastidiosa subsp. multiplex]QTX28176.1 hypothetical protein KBP49_01125 [Xylella fastidiosa subsp. multiplex]TNV90400.1 hypothetical protein C5H23_02100 [Xylella fastidiosa]TNV98212.1 hypothetical protein C5H21_09525 [Xylella fastidiosa]
MSFRTLCHRVERAERLVEERSKQTCNHWQELQHSWQATWTPLRIVITGLGLGFIAGRVKPSITLKTFTDKFGSAKHLIQILGAMSTFFTTTCADNASKQNKPSTEESHTTTKSQPTADIINLSEHA